MKFSPLFIAVLISLTGSTPFAASAVKCDLVFSPSVRDTLDLLNGENNQFLFQGKNLETFSQNYSWLRKRKIRKLTQEFDIGKLPSPEALERYAITLSTTLFGSKEVVDRWIFKSPDQRLEESTLLLIKESLLQQGLLKTWQEAYNPERISTLKKSLDRIKNFQNGTYGQFTKLPFVLPFVKNSEISAELMAKIIRDGFTTHAEEARTALKKQNKIEAYNTFRKLYSPTYFGVLLIVSLQQAYTEMEREMDAQVAKIIHVLRAQRESIEKAVPGVKLEIFNKAYADAIQEYTQKWGEPPTPEEQAQLKAKIEKGLNMN